MRTRDVATLVLYALAVVLPLVVLGAPAAFAQARAPGVTDTEIAIGVSVPLSGPAALYGNLGVAQDAWARYVNDQGGIHGRKLRVVLRDDGFNPGRAVANLRELKDSTFLNVGMVGSAIAHAAKDDVAR